MIIAKQKKTKGVKKMKKSEKTLADSGNDPQNASYGNDVINSDKLQFLDLLSHLADTDDPFDFGRNFTDDKEWIVDPADIDDNYDWQKRLDTISGRKTIGNDKVGHIEIPASWAEYREDDPNIIDYRDASGKEVVTLTKVPCTDGNTFKAFYSAYQICRNDPTCKIVCTYRCRIEGRECYRIDVHYDTTETYQSAWVTKGGDDFCYFLSLEAADIYNTELARTYALPKE